ncbi:MAG TPA: exosortase family protein XrtF [Cyclobacteriaceae bacterium]|nr:exosortase family protein XrtF [Cyclobacteriaceae bacterium]
MTNSVNLREFAPAIRFLVVFLGIYLGGNILYGLYVEFYRPGPDAATVAVTRQTTGLLNFFGEPTGTKLDAMSPYVQLLRDNKIVLRVFEGCNGLNVMVIFLAFVLAFGGKAKRMVPYIFFGIVVIHAANLLRIILLYYTALYRPILFYYFHKYFFTAVLYMVVFALWFAWMRLKFRERATAKA